MIDTLVNRLRPLAERVGLFLCACLVVMLTLGGWGWWGFGADGDYALDMMDALRRFQGEIPYRDFIPTYGALHVHLVAPLFSLGDHTLSVIWIATAFLIWIQSWMVMRIAGIIRPGWWTIGVGALFLTLCAFPSYGTKFLVGYSQSGFLGSWLFTLLLVTLIGTKISSVSTPFSPRWFLTGVLLGAQLFTKMDAGMAAIFVGVALLIILLADRLKRDAIALLTGYGSVCVGMWTFLWLQGGKPSLIIETALEGFFVAGVVRDYALQKRLMLLGTLVLASAIAMLVPSLRSRLLQLRPFTSLGLLLGLPLVFVWDAWRVSRHGSGCDMVGANYFFCGAVLLVSSRYFVTVWRCRSIALFQQGGHLWKGIACIIGLAGIARAALSGWVVLGYYQPALFLVAMLAWRRSWESLSQSRVWGGAGRSRLLTISSVSMVLLIVVSFGKSWCTVRPAMDLIPFDSPWGKICYPPSFHRDLLFELRRRGTGGYLFSNHLPGVYFHTGMRCASFHTWSARVGMSGRYQKQREEQTLAQFLRLQPRYVVLTDEKYRQFAIPQFGKDYGIDLWNFIQANYRPIQRFGPPSGKGGSILWEKLPEPGSP